ncbi:uncharacterized protein LOC135687468 [Rhopilema esculentum]|uniref:uncharacterized protein LOC135687468 n=1 Tax=Rhopilema esculentum TaxID=499914 RepID=UPI0031CDB0B2|eukprot:gene6441-11885_t
MAAPIRSNVMSPFRHKAIFSALCGRLTQLRNYSQALIDHEANDISTGSEMPFMVPPQVVRKGFEVHPTPRTFTLRPDEKMKWLTKTYLTEGLPDELSSTDCDKESINFVKDCLHQIFGFQVHPHRPSNTFFEEELSLGLLQQMMQVAMMTSPENSQDLFIHRRPLIETNWFRNYVFYHAKYHPSFALRVSDKLPAMKSTFPLPIDEFPLSMPGPFDTYSIGAYEKSIIRLRNSTGVRHTEHFTKRHLHTVMQINSQIKGEDFFQACGLATSFTNLLAIAHDHGHHQGLPLKEPLNCNCIISNGVSMLFMVYQLNTTEMNDDKGIWNRAWCSPLMPLFTPKDGLPTKRQLHEIADTDKLLNFNEDAVALFLKLLHR